MARASVQERREVERHFPVRVRIAVPPEGLGRQIEIMHAWLDQTCGAEGWAMAPAGFIGVVNDAIAFYFHSAALARAFVTRFCCGYRIVESVEGALPSVMTRQHRGVAFRSTRPHDGSPGSPIS